MFLAQLNCLNWLGALVFVLFQAGITLTALACLARLSGRAPGFAALAPLFVLLLLRNRYGCPTAAMSIGVLLALTTAVIYLWLPWRRPWSLTAASGLTSVLLFWVAGLWPTLLFAVLCGLFVGIRRRNWRAGSACLVLAAAAPMLAGGVGFPHGARLVHPWPEGLGGVLAAILWASVPFAGAVLAALPTPAPNPSAPTPNRGSVTARTRLAIVVSAFAFGWATVWFTFDQQQKRLAEIDYRASRGEYEAVLAAAGRTKVLDDPAKFRVQWALYHTGRLAEELFSFHDLVDEAPPAGVGETCRAQSQSLFELGLLNDADHTAHEALEMQGDRPDLLRLLARLNLLKDRPQAAQVFLNVLSLIPFQGERANEAWPTLDVPRPAAEQALLARLRAQALTNDVLHTGLPMGRLLEVLLASNPTNQMAFEYAMADYLVGLDLRNVVEHLPLLDNFHYPRIPRSYEEALLLYQQVARVQVALNGRAISPETAERFRQFKEAAKWFMGSAEDKAALAARFGNTYWYYHFITRGRQRAAESQASAPQ